MNTIRFFAPLALVVLGTGCSFAVRSPEMYRDDTQKLLAGKSEEIKTCYDGVVKTTPGAGGKVTVKFTVEEKTGKIGEITVDKANTNAPDAVAACLTNAMAGLTLNPGDQKKGEATFTYDFTAPPPPPPPAAAAAAPTAPAAPVAK